MVQPANKRLVTYAEQTTVMSAEVARADAAYPAQALTGVWIGTQKYATLDAAITAANSFGGCEIKFIGDITPSTLPIITASNTKLRSVGGAGIIRQASGQTEVLRVGSKTSGTAVTGVVLEDLQLIGTSTTTRALNLIGVQQSAFRNVRISGASGSGAWGWVFDTQSTGSFVACINNTTTGGYITGCYNGVQLTKDAADTGTDGCNHNTFVGTRGASFTGIGLDNDAGENNCFDHVDFSTGNNGATGIRINDDVCTLISPRSDNSFGVGNTGIGIRLTANARDHYITNPAGDGPTTRILYDDPTIPGQVIRQGFTVEVGNRRRSQVATGSDFWLGRAWANVGTSTISAGEIGYYDSTMTEGQVKRGNSAVTCTNPMVAVESIAASATGAFAEPGSVLAVKVDAGAVAVGDLLVPSTTVNGAVKVDNTNTNPRLNVGRARTSIAAGNSGSTVKVYIR